MMNSLYPYFSALGRGNKLVCCSATLFFVLIVKVGDLTTRPEAEYKQRLIDLETDWKCNRCQDALENEGSARDDCEIDLQEICLARGWDFYPMSAVCLDDKQIVSSLKKIVNDSVREEIQDLTESKKSAQLVRRSIRAFQSSPRFIIHRFFRWTTSRRSQSDDKAWITAYDFERHRSTYTVSPGMTDSYNDGSLVIPENGLYMIYVKLTFSCLRYSPKAKRVGLKVSVEETPLYPPFHLLQRVEKEWCYRPGDLTTIYQQGLFRLAKGNKVIVQYKLAKNVEISSRRNSPYKSYIGVTRIGLA